MVLGIRGDHTSKDITWGYSRLHLVRDLAYIACGLSRDVAYLRRYGFGLKDIFKHHLEVNEPIPVISSDDLFNFVKAGYHFPNLLFHSDCEGVYTSRGEVMQDSEWKSGNIFGLHAELKMLMGYRQDKEVVDLEKKTGAVKALEDLFDLVDDEIKHKRPRIVFG